MDEIQQGNPSATPYQLGTVPPAVQPAAAEATPAPEVMPQVPLAPSTLSETNPPQGKSKFKLWIVIFAGVVILAILGAWLFSKPKEFKGALVNQESQQGVPSSTQEMEQAVIKIKALALEAEALEKSASLTSQEAQNILLQMPEAKIPVDEAISAAREAKLGLAKLNKIALVAEGMTQVADVKAALIETENTLSKISSATEKAKQATDAAKKLLADRLIAFQQACKGTPNASWFETDNICEFNNKKLQSISDLENEKSALQKAEEERRQAQARTAQTPSQISDQESRALRAQIDGLNQQLAAVQREAERNSLLAQIEGLRTQLNQRGTAQQTPQVVINLSQTGTSTGTSSVPAIGSTTAIAQTPQTQASQNASTGTGQVITIGTKTSRQKKTAPQTVTQEPVATAEVQDKDIRATTAETVGDASSQSKAAQAKVTAQKESKAASAAQTAQTKKLHGAYIQGQTGPGILLYPVLIGLANGMYYYVRKRKVRKK